MNFSMAHLARDDAAAARRNDQSNREPKTSYAGMVEKRFSVSSSGDDDGGNEDLI
jgi:hypothetical protein